MSKVGVDGYALGACDACFHESVNRVVSGSTNA
jgi:hypothetical protein